jgi:cell fate (sporulation/competence/biofilm development) regulator YlbF (YheA/YmcA/DUF963 family)
MTRIEGKYMDAITKAKELGELIAESKEMLNYKNAEAAMEQDEKARTLLNDYKLLQIEMVKVVKGNSDKDVVDGMRERLLAKQQELNSCEAAKNFLDSKASVDKLMKTINDVIIFAVTGEEPCSPKKCSSCGGGCR